MNALQRRTLVLFSLAAFFGAHNPAQAVPVVAAYVDTSDCDFHGPLTLGHELGDIFEGFPIDEAIGVAVQQVSQYVCVGDDGIPNDWQVQITNHSPHNYEDLFVVADDGIAIGNFDGLISDAVNAPTVSTTAFRIDNVGGNNSLTGDNGNLIFETNEVWTFLITNLIDVNNVTLTPPPFFGSIGLFSGSSAVLNDRSTMSIVANRLPIPEPSSFGLLLLGSTWLATAVRKRGRPPAGLSISMSTSDFRTQR